MKTTFLSIIIVLSCLQLTAQIPSWLPTNGLVAWYPFNGNANDESGNGNDGTVTNATLTPDRLGNPNKAYMFNGIDRSYRGTGHSYIEGKKYIYDCLD